MTKCVIYEKVAHFGNSVSHSHRRSNRIREADVKSVKVKTEGGARKMCTYTSYLRSNFAERA